MSIWPWLILGCETDQRCVVLLVDFQTKSSILKLFIYVQLNLLNWARNIFDRLTQLELFLKPSLTYADLMEITHSP